MGEGTYNFAMQVSGEIHASATLPLGKESLLLIE
jgi:hypothetical protein